MSMRSRPVSEPLSVSENSPTAAWPLRSSGTAHKPRLRRSVTPSRPTSLPARVIASGRGASVSPLIALKSSFCPLPATPATPKISPALHFERDVLQRDAEFARLRQAQALRRELRSRRSRGLAGLAISFRFGADHHLGHRARGLALRVAVGDDLAAAQDGRGVAERDDLVQLVRDVEDRAAARGEFPQGLEQLLDLLRRQHRGRLVHDQEPRIEEQRAHDLDPLALADAERRDDRGADRA